jgi:hypothetical protein
MVMPICEMSFSLGAIINSGIAWPMAAQEYIIKISYHGPWAYDPYLIFLCLRTLELSFLFQANYTEIHTLKKINKKKANCTQIQTLNG